MGGLQQARAVGPWAGLAAYESGRAEPVERAHKKVPVAGHRQVDRDQIFDLGVEGGPRYLQTRESSSALENDGVVFLRGSQCACYRVNDGLQLSGGVAYLIFLM